MATHLASAWLACNNDWHELNARDHGREVDPATADDVLWALRDDR